MKYLIYLFVLMALLLFACGESVTTTSPQEEERESIPTSDQPEIEAPGTAICLWSKVGLREEPGKGKSAKWITSVVFGEKVDLTGEEEDVEGKNYLEMKLSDGKTGFAQEYLFAVNAELAAATGEIEVYPRPDIMTFKGDKFNRGEILALIRHEDQEGWLEAIGKEKKPSGWIRKNSLVSTEQNDVAVAVLFQRALEQGSAGEKEAALRQILDNKEFSNSVLAGMIDQELSKGAADEDSDSGDQITITADGVRVRNSPKIEDGNVLFSLSTGAVVEVLEKGESETIDGKEDNWYKIKSDQGSGWVFGQFLSKPIAD